MAQYFKLKIENIINIKYIVKIEYLELFKKYVHQHEQHNFWKTIFADKGSIIISHENNDIVVNEGEIYFINPNQIHSVRANNLVAPCIFIMCFDCSSPIMKAFNNFKLYVSKKNKSILSSIMIETKETFEQPLKEKLVFLKNPNICGQQVIRIYLELFLINLLRDISTKECTNTIFLPLNKFDENIAQLMLEFMQNKIYNEITIEEICKKFNYSKSHLSTAFKRQFNKTIIQYYNELKINEAKKLIREQTSTFAEISNLLHFNDSHYFTSLFKKITQMTPTQYKNSIRTID